MKRTPLKRRKRLNPVSKKTRTVRWPALKTLRARVIARACCNCEACHACIVGAKLEVHHVIKRSQGGPDTPDNCIALCRRCHDRTDWPWTKGRLCIKALGNEKFLAIVFFRGFSAWKNAVIPVSVGI